MKFRRRTRSIARIFTTIEKIALKHFPHQYIGKLWLLDDCNTISKKKKKFSVIRLIEAFFGNSPLCHDEEEQSMNYRVARSNANEKVITKNRLHGFYGAFEMLIRCRAAVSKNSIEFRVCFFCSAHRQS